VRLPPVLSGLRPFLLLASCLLGTSPLLAFDYADARSKAVKAIKQRFAGFSLNRSYTVRATLMLDVGFGGQSGYWSPAFIEGVFPARERSQSITRPATF